MINILPEKRAHTCASNNDQVMLERHSNKFTAGITVSERVGNIYRAPKLEKLCHVLKKVQIARLERDMGVKAELVTGLCHCFR